MSFGTQGYATTHHANAVVLSFGVINIGCFCVYYEYQKEQHRKTTIEMEREIQANEKFVGLGRISSGIAHEVNNPLAVIALNLMGLKHQHAKLLEDKAIDTQVYDALEKKTGNAINSIRQLNNVVKTLKELIQSEKISYEPIAVKHLFEQVLSEHAEQIDHFDIDVELACQHPDAVINRIAFIPRQPLSPNPLAIRWPR